MLPSTGIVATSRSGVASSDLDPHPLHQGVRVHRPHGRRRRHSGGEPVGREWSGTALVGWRHWTCQVMVVPAPCVSCLLLDGHSLAYRAFFALPAENFSTSTGQHTNAVYGFTSMLINVLRDEAPDPLGVAFDVSRKTFRAEEYPEYKAGRSATPTEFSGQLPLLREVLDALRIRHARSTASRPTTSSPPSPPGRSSRASRCSSAPATGTRSSWSATSHGALPGAGRVRGLPGWTPPRSTTSTACRPSATATSQPWSASRATTCPACPGSGRRPRPSG